MGLGFRKSFKIAPGIRFNVRKKGMGLSVGGKGLRYSVNTSGNRRATASIPGTGISYSVSPTSNKRNYRTKAYQQNSQLKKLQKEMEKLEEVKCNQLEVDIFENRLEMIKSLHKECDESVNWEEIKTSSPPFILGEKGSNELQAIKELENYKPSFLEKLFKQDKKKRQELMLKVEEAIKQDQIEYQEWERLIKVATSILDGDTDTYFEVLDEFAPFDDLSEFGSGFEFFVEEPHFMEIEYDVHADSVVPQQLKSLTQTGKLSVKQMPKSMFFDLQQDYVCSCVIRIARDLFALLPLKYVIIHANDDTLNQSTGHIEKQTILSVKIDRETLNSLNLDTIDCSDSMQNFEHNMKFLKTKGLQKVEKIK